MELQLLNETELKTQLYLDGKVVDFEVLNEMEKEISVVDENSARNALSMSLQTRKIRNQIETSRKEIVKPHLDYQRAINKLVKDVESVLDRIESSLESKIGDWMKAQKDNPFTAVDEIEVEDGKIYYDKKWDYQVYDYTILPMELLTPCDEAIKEQIKQGVRNIPGVKIFQTCDTRMRVKN